MRTVLAGVFVLLLICGATAPAVASPSTDISAPVGFADHYTRDTGDDSDDSDADDSDPPSDAGRYRDGGLSSGIGGGDESDDGDDSDDTADRDDSDDDDDTDEYDGPTVEDLPIRDEDESDEEESPAVGGGGGGLIGLSPTDFVKDILAWFASAAVEQAAGQIDFIVTVISGMPAPGEPTDPGSWTDPQNGLWPGVYDATAMTYPLAVLFVAVATMRAFLTTNAYERRDRLRTAGVAFAMILLTWVVAPLGLHLGSTLGTAFAPSGSEFMSSPDEFAKLSLGIILGAALAIVYSSVVVIGVLILGVQYFLTHVVVFLWPLAWGVWALGGYGESLGNLNHYLFLTLVVLNVAQAMLLRLLFELPWSGGPIETVLMSFLAQAGGLLVTLVVLPVVLIKQATTGAAVGLGMSAASTGAAAAGEYARDGGQRVVERVKQIDTTRPRNRDDDDDLPDW